MDIKKEAYKQVCSDKEKRDKVGGISGGYDLKEVMERQSMIDSEPGTWWTKVYGSKKRLQCD